MLLYIANKKALPVGRAFLLARVKMLVKEKTDCLPSRSRNRRQNGVQRIVVAQGIQHKAKVAECVDLLRLAGQIDVHGPSGGAACAGGHWAGLAGRITHGLYYNIRARVSYPQLVHAQRGYLRAAPRCYGRPLNLNWNGHGFGSAHHHIGGVRIGARLLCYTHKSAVVAQCFGSSNGLG
jgi:hypothetical protein